MKPYNSFLLIIGICSFLSLPPIMSCDFPPQSLFGNDVKEYKGQYLNEAFRFSVTIPRGFVGKAAKDPFYQRGFGIVLEPIPVGYIDIFAEKNSLEYVHPVERALDVLDYLRRSGKLMQQISITMSALDGLESAALEARYKCAGGDTTYIQYSIYAVNGDKTLLYELSLYCPEPRYSKDRLLMDELVRTWRQVCKKD